ncbi:MAG: insulinase family protein [Planctomycetota bacterium]
MGHLAVKRDHPDYFPLLIMNNILGGGGFTSRIMSRVRSDEGLAYTARSAYSFGTHYAGSFRAFYQSKSESCAHALQLVLDEIEKIRKEKVSDEELQGAINYYVGVFPRNFSSPSTVASTFADDELTGRPAGFWSKFLDGVRAVKADDVLRVAKTHLKPENLTILVVGKMDDILKGDPDNPQYSLKTIAGAKGITEIPLPDPETLVYPKSGS